MIVFESLANAYFFAEGSSLGFLGGWIQSIVVSLLVILASAKLIGSRVVPLLNHTREKWKVIGGGMLGLYVVLLLALALLVAHYRLLLTTDPENALVKTLPHFLQSTWAIDPISWIFFGVSVLFGISAVIAGYTSDDKYPGYGELDRRHKRVELEYNDAKSELVRAINGSYDEASNAVTRLVSEAQAAIHQHELLVPRVRSIQAEYVTYAANVQQACNALLRRYRDRNNKVRTAPPPAYFDTAYSFDSGVSVSIPSLEGVERRNSEFNRTLALLLEKATQVRVTLQQMADGRRLRLRTFIEEIESIVVRKLDEETHPQG
jgi:hypothetical protein